MIIMIILHQYYFTICTITGACSKRLIWACMSAELKFSTGTWWTVDKSVSFQNLCHLAPPYACYWTELQDLDLKYIYILRKNQHEILENVRRIAFGNFWHIPSEIVVGAFDVLALNCVFSCSAMQKQTRRLLWLILLSSKLPTPDFPGIAPQFVRLPRNNQTPAKSSIQFQGRRRA